MAGTEKLDQPPAAQPVAWTTEVALECAPNTLAFEVCAGNLWGERGVPLYRQPDPRIAEYLELLREVLRDEDQYGEIRQALALRIAAALKEG